jgi:hypothetical protein
MAYQQKIRKKKSKGEMIYELKQVGYKNLSNKPKWHIEDLYDEAKSEGEFD